MLMNQVLKVQLLGRRLEHLDVSLLLANTHEIVVNTGGGGGGCSFADKLDERFAGWISLVIVHHMHTLALYPLGKVSEECNNVLHLKKNDFRSRILGDFIVF